MWTYLTILLSITLLVGIFARRVYLYFKKGSKIEEPIKKVEEKIKEEEKNIKKVKKRITKNDKETVEELCNQAESKIKYGKEDEAIKLFIQALAIDELNVETQHKLAMLYMKKQMFSAAAALFKSLGEATNEPVHYSHLGLALFQQGLFDDAKSAYQQAIVLDPSRPQRYASLAQVYRSLGQMQNSIIALNKAIEIDQENMDFLFLLADLQKELGNKKEAKEIIDRVLELDSNNREAKQFLKDL